MEKIKQKKQRLKKNSLNFVWLDASKYKAADIQTMSHNSLFARCNW